MTVETSTAVPVEKTRYSNRPTSTLKAIAGATATLVALVIVWEVLVRQFQVPSWLLPAPSLIAQAMLEWRAELGRAFPCHPLRDAGRLCARHRNQPAARGRGGLLAVLQNTIYPILLALQSMPKVAIAPLLALWIGFGTLPKIVVVFLVCFFPIIVATTSGLTAVPTSLMDLIRSLSATRCRHS